MYYVYPNTFIESRLEIKIRTLYMDQRKKTIHFTVTKIVISNFIHSDEKIQKQKKSMMESNSQQIPNGKWHMKL